MTFSTTSAGKMFWFNSGGTFQSVGFAGERCLFNFAVSRASNDTKISRDLVTKTNFDNVSLCKKKRTRNVWWW